MIELDDLVYGLARGGTLSDGGLACRGVRRGGSLDRPGFQVDFLPLRAPDDYTRQRHQPRRGPTFFHVLLIGKTNRLSD
jgi:hypothetical protein